MLRSLLLWITLTLASLATFSLLSAQSTSLKDLFDQAPPDVEEALRRRVSGFFQAHVTGKFREADQYVAEDSKDAFFSMNKNRYRGFEIIKVKWEEDLKKASVLTAVDTDFVMPFGGARVPVKAPITTLWKIDNGQWCWYVPENNGMETPFGRMTPGPDNPSPSLPLPAGRELEALSGQVKVSKTEVSLTTTAPNSDEITITNNLPGSVSLEMNYPNIIDFSARLEKTNLNAGEATKLLVRWNSDAGGERGSIPIRLTVMPLNLTYNIEVKLHSSPLKGPEPAASPKPQ